MKLGLLFVFTLLVMVPSLSEGFNICRRAKRLTSNLVTRLGTFRPEARAFVKRGEFNKTTSGINDVDKYPQ